MSSEEKTDLLRTTSDNTRSAQQLDKLRQKFFKRLRREVLQWGGEMLDLAWTYYPQDQAMQPDLKSGNADEGGNEIIKDQADTPRLVVDRVNLPHLRCSSFDFIDSVQRDWWPNRARVQPDAEAEEVEAIVGFYGRYLGASGYALVIEFNPQHAQDPQLKPALWRVDARPEGVQITFPQDEGEVYSQLGAYLDLQEGWAWLARESMKAEAMITAEVEPGYLIGVRPGDPMSELHPAEREDPEIEEVFSRFDAERFDTLEFINSEESEDYPFDSERYHSWLPSDVVEALDDGKFEAFILSQSERFFEAIEEVAERRKVEVSLKETDGVPILIFNRGPLSLKRQFSLPYLWTLHSGRQHHEGAVEYFRDDLIKLFEASELFFEIRRVLIDAHGEEALSIEIEDGDLLTIKERGGEGRMWMRLSLFDWISEGIFEGKEGAIRFLSLLGWSAHPPQWMAPAHALDQCPICDQEARLHKLIRPRLAHDAGRQSGIGHQVKERLPEHIWASYALVCSQHKVPVFWSRREAIHQAFELQTHQVLEITSAQELEVSGAKLELLWGEELAGALLNENNRETLRERGALFAHAVTPDLVILSLLPISEDLLAISEPKCAQMIAQFGPDRDWRLGWTLELR